MRIRKSALRKILNQAERDYPYETCGLLLGRWEGNDRTVFEAFETPNVNKSRKRDRYEISPVDYLRAEKKAKSLGLEVVGVYHSHPDHPDRPSKFDAERAFEGFSYIIVSVCEGKVVSYRSWEFCDEGFKEERIKVFGKS